MRRLGAFSLYWDSNAFALGEREDGIPEGSRVRVPMLKNYKELKAWKKSYELCLKTSQK
jgi:hypothetical protein